MLMLNKSLLHGLIGSNNGFGETDLSVAYDTKLLAFCLRFADVSLTGIVAVLVFSPSTQHYSRLQVTAFERGNACVDVHDASDGIRQYCFTMNAVAHARTHDYQML